MNFMNFLIALKEKIFNVIKIVWGNKKILKIVALVGIIIILLTTFVLVKNLFLKRKEEKERPLTKVKVEKVIRSDYSQKYPVMGTIKGAVENELRFEIEGVLLKYNYKEGAKIRKGEIIAYLDPKDALAKLTYAKSKYESEKATYYSAEQKLKVYEEMYKLKAISESKLIEMRYEVEAIRQRMATALAELELAQSYLLKTNLYAPSNGILAQIIIQPGEFVTPQDVVAKFVSKGDAIFEVEIPEKDVQQIKVGLPVSIYCDAYPDKVFNGSLSEISPIVKERTRTVVVKISVPNEEGLLRSGMFARGDIFISSATNVITVPVDSVISLGEQTKLLPLIKPIEGKQNQAVVELRQIKVADTIGNRVIITDGVEEGELYIVETSGELSDGIVVEYIEAVRQE